MSVQCRCGGTIADTGMCPGCGTEGPRYQQALSAANATCGAVVRELHPVIVASPGGRNLGDKPEIEAPTGPASIRALRSAIDAGTIPGTYVSNGSVVVVERVSGTPGAVTGGEDSPLPVTASEVRAPGLAALLAAHTYTFQVKTRRADGGTETYPEEVTPPNAVLGAALEPKEWPRLRPLFGIVGAPVLRPDGRLLQQPGYDPATSLYLASKVPLDPVPGQPSKKQVRAAREFLLGRFLGDFPWVSEADKANYAGLLVTPILRSYLRTLIPFGVVTSTMPGSGKTILTCGLGMLYGQRVLTWTHSDEELRKAITSVLADPVGTIIFDNLAEGTVIDSPVLARLITDRTWADRLLGKNSTAAFANDRVWTATGNNLRLGGDMRTRSVLVSLNPNMPRPEERTGFQIPSLDQWILTPANQRQVLWHLLVLVADWTRNGAPRREGLTMRQFTPWAEAVGGFLAHHGIGGFLANVETVRDIDEEEATWAAFFAQWHKLHGDRWLTSNEVRLSADVPLSEHDPWDGCFVTDGAAGSPPRSPLASCSPGRSTATARLMFCAASRTSTARSAPGASRNGPDKRQASRGVRARSPPRRDGKRPVRARDLHPANPANRRSGAGKPCGV